MDDLEGQLALEIMLPNIREHFENLVKPFAVIEQQNWITGEARKAMDFAARAQWWFSELAKRRAVWCWNLYDGPSNAMWHIYGWRGVLIHSTIGRVKRAQAGIGDSRGLISPVGYRPPSSQFQTAAEKFQGSRRDTWASWYMRPHLDLAVRLEG
jgi:hypothetical protein